MHVLAAEIFLGKAAKILDQHFKIRPSADHRAKFHAGRPKHIGELALKLKKRLEIWGKAQRESARRPKSNLGEITVWGKISPASNSRRPFSASKKILRRFLKILDRHYKIGPNTNHRAKFHAGRSKHLGNLMLTKETRNLGQSLT